jgi:hypothetical protein
MVWKKQLVHLFIASIPMLSAIDHLRVSRSRDIYALTSPTRTHSAILYHFSIGLHVNACRFWPLNSYYNRSFWQLPGFSSNASWCQVSSLYASEESWWTNTMFFRFISWPALFIGVSNLPEVAVRNWRLGEGIYLLLKPGISLWLVLAPVFNHVYIYSAGYFLSKKVNVLHKNE